MAYCTERQKMEFRLLKSIVEPQDSITRSSSSSSSSNGSDVTESPADSDGDTPIVVVSDRLDTTTLCNQSKYQVLFQIKKCP